MERAAQTERDEGFSLVELLVVVVLLSVVGGIVLSAVTAGLGSQRATTNRLDALHELEIAVQRASRDFRAASPLVLSTTVPADTTAGVVLDRGGVEHQILYSVVDSGEFQELIQETTVAGEVTQRQLVTRIENVVVDDDGVVVNDVPVFRYFRRDGTEIVCDNTASGDEGEECRASLLLTSSISIQLLRSVQETTPVDVSTTVSVRSVRYRFG